MKKFNKILFALVLAAAGFTSCGGISGNFDAEVSSSNVDVSRSLGQVDQIVRISSDLNPGYGNAVYFTGTFNEGNEWTTAVRGSYDNGWYVEVNASAAFEWKALTGSYDLGEIVSISGSNLVWENGENHVQNVDTKYIYLLSSPGYAKYGQVCYFTGTFNEGNNWQTAIDAQYFSWETYRWYAYVTTNSESFEWKALKGFGSHGETYDAPFNGLNWEEGSNHTEADAYSFEYGWTQLDSGYFSAYYDKDTIHLYGSGEVNGMNRKYQDVDATLIEILAEDKVIYSARYFDVKENGIYFPVDKFDYKVYTVQLVPISIYGTRGKVNTYKFSPAMVRFDRASFTMGSDSDEAEDNAEHNVTISEGYYIGKYEVTDKEFVELFGSSSSWLGYKISVTDYCPAVCVTFPFAIAYCNKLSIKYGLEPVYSIDGVDFETVTFSDIRYLSAEESAKWEAPSVNWDANGFRLPTEAEWEYAAVFGQAKFKFSGSDDLSEVCGSMYFKPAEVGSAKENLSGIYDMSGNAEEWVWDWYAPYSTEFQENPRGPETGTSHVTRGGGFSQYGTDFFTTRFRHPTASYSSSTGLRLVRKAF